MKTSTNTLSYWWMIVGKITLFIFRGNLWYRMDSISGNPEAILFASLSSPIMSTS